VARIEPEYESLDKRLTEAGVVTSLAELHGGMCGTMCVGGIAATQRWLDDCLDDWQLVEPDEIGETLRGLELDAWSKLSSPDMSFEPLLPGEDQPLDAQVRGLALWCHGFLAGLGLGGLKARDGSCRSETVDEITKDFSEISRAALVGEDDDEEDAAGFALAELKEYVRVGVQLVFEECGAGAPSAGGSVH
jgi:uncharacterized protein YgfB (UPF0149 family)